ncbi:MAG: PKD domain-containing protein [Bacteroidetes bacterium]|nr:PKD domain-containing protein [Bacteroidota bacterium]
MNNPYNSATYENTGLAVNDQVQVILTSNALCSTTPTATSNILKAHPSVDTFFVSGGLCVPALMTLTGSQVGVQYQVQKDGFNIGAPIAGNGSPLNLGFRVDTGVYTVVATNPVTGCISNMTGALSVGICTATWTGTASTEWENPLNWNPQAFPDACGENAVIPAGTPFSPIISVTDIDIGSMDIAAGAVLTLQGKNLNVCGQHWAGGAGNDAAIVGSGTVYLNSAAWTQNVIGNTVFNILQINNNDGILFNAGADVAITNGLHLQHGGVDLSAGTLTLKSNASNHNSYIDDFTFGFDGTLTGNVRAERYIPTLGSNQHFMSSPVNSAPLSQLGASGPDGSYVTPYPTCDETKSNWGSAYGTTFVYNDGHMAASSCMLGNWMIKSAGNMDNGRGYSTYQMGNATRTLVGAANTGNINIGGLNNSGYPTVNTLQAQPIESGWNLVGNPYPSALDLTVDRTADGFGNQVQVWKTTGPFSGSWQPAVINGTSGTVVIAPFQAFMVRVTPGSLGNHTYRFYQSERIRSTSIQFFRTDAANALKLELNYANGGKDETRVEFNAEASTTFDDLYDANKPGSAPGVPTLYTHMNANMWYGINTLPSLTEVTTVPMGLRADMNGTMTITPQGIQSFDPTTYIFLEDKKTNTWHNLRNGSYTFTASKTDNQDRFVLHFTPPANILTTDATCSGSGQIEITQPGSANWNYTVTDVNSTTISSGTLNSGNPMTISANSGVYQLTLTDNNGYIVIKNIEIGGNQQITANFIANSQLVTTGEEISFQVTTTNAATQQWNFGDGATSTATTPTHSYATEGVYTVTLTVTSDGGCISTTTQSITVTGKAATSLNDLKNNPITIWSSNNRVYVDFGKQKKVEAEIELYNVIGQLISREKFGRSTIYSKEIPNIEAAYIIVRVNNDDKVTTKKVFIANAMK